jgi:hypothetical protein
MIKRGPVDVIIMAVGQPKFEGQVVKELENLSAAGTIRVLDAMVLLKDERGRPWRLELKDLPPAQQAAVGFISEETRGLFDSEDASSLYEAMVPGSAVIAMAIEHLWAVNLVNALYDAGVELASHFRVPATEVDEAFASLTEKA